MQIHFCIFCHIDILMFLKFVWTHTLRSVSHPWMLIPPSPLTAQQGAWKGHSPEEPGVLLPETGPDFLLPPQTTVPGESWVWDSYGIGVAMVMEGVALDHWTFEEGVCSELHLGGCVCCPSKHLPFSVIPSSVCYANDPTEPQCLSGCADTQTTLPARRLLRTVYEEFQWSSWINSSLPMGFGKLGSKSSACRCWWKEW